MFAPRDARTVVIDLHGVLGPFHPEMSNPPKRVTLSPNLTRSIAASLGIGVFLTFTDPFGATRDLNLWNSFLYWTSLVIIGWFSGPLIVEGIRRIAPGLDPRANIVIATILVAAVVTGAIVLVQALFIKVAVPASYLPRLYVLVLGISAGVASVSWLVDRAFSGPPGVITHAPFEGAPAPSIRFLDRFPPKLKGAVLYAVSSEDHYLRLHTSKGSDLILMRLSDAIVELEGLEGAQTHRSWWVARDAVEGAKRDGDRVTLLVKSGVEAPVSRPNVKPLREAGWF